MVAMKNIKAVIFDLDDTLYLEKDYVISGFKCVAEYLSKKLSIGSKQIFEEFFVLFEENRYNVFNRFFNIHNIFEEHLLTECVEVYRNHYPDIKLIPEAINVLKWLKANNYKIGLLTDGRPEGQRNKIRALNLEKFCDCINITDELGGIRYRKPNEIPYKIILNELKVKPEEAIYVGDNPAKDFISANKLGLITIMVNYCRGLYHITNLSKEYLAMYSVDKLLKVKELLQNWNEQIDK